MRFTKKTAQAMGRLGGLACHARHGAAHMQAIGRKGFQATCDRLYGGDRRAMLNELIARGLRAQDSCPSNGFHQNYQAFPPLPSSEEPEPCS